jgi:hypothetical protein
LNGKLKSLDTFEVILSLTLEHPIRVRVVETGKARLAVFHPVLVEFNDAAAGGFGVDHSVTCCGWCFARDTSSLHFDEQYTEVTRRGLQHHGELHKDATNSGVAPTRRRVRVWAIAAQRRRDTAARSLFASFSALRRAMIASTTFRFS